MLSNYGNAYLGFTRLAINGLTVNGNQPINTNNMAVICNGEIYNYKDLARRGLVRMHEEFQELLNLWRGKQERLSSKQKQECMAFMILVITEVPRWKVPAAQPLIKDPTVMSRAVQQSVRFFQEVLVKPRVNSIMPKDIAGTKTKKKVILSTAKTDSSEDKMRLMDEMVMAFIQR